MEFSVEGLKHIMREISRKRVARDAAIALNDELEEHGLLIAKRAWEIAQEDGRVTVKETDIKAAVREIKVNHGN